ncbi:MAG: formyltetrahydrofolate deformylase [Verrucomicrobiota bacterium]
MASFLSSTHSNAILLVSSPDQTGIVAAISNFLFENSGNIVDVDQHVDREDRAFFMRIEWEVEGFAIERAAIAERFKPIADKFGMEWALHFSDELPKVALFATRDNHCLYDLLSRYESGELRMEIPLIISNRESLRPAADRFGIPFHYLPITKENKQEQERKEIELLNEHGCELAVLARYMQILSPQLVDAFPSRIINIHHSFLPAFPGAKPYHSAYQRGVKSSEPLVTM